MIRKWAKRATRPGQHRQTSHRVGIFSRRAGFEILEDRRMLAGMADIVFLVDESASLNQEYPWIANIVNGPNGLDAYLNDPSREISPRYGLIGYGDSDNHLGYSHLLDNSDNNGDGDKLFGTASQLADVVVDVTNQGSLEVAWEAIEHGLAEYEFRPGAAVIFVLFRRDDFGGGGNFAGTDPWDTIRTFTGTLAALESYNVSLNTVIEATFDPAMFASPGGIVLGVEADETDNMLDGEHIAHVINAVANQPTIPDALPISFQGSDAGEFISTGESIRISTSGPAEVAGPDTFGYRARSSTDVFTDISATGTRISTWDNSTSVPYRELSDTDLGSFAFNFYGSGYSSLFVNANGTLTFDQGHGGEGDFFFNDWSVTPPPQPTIAVLWNEFDFSESYDVFWKVVDAGTAQERLVVQWDGMNYALDSGTGSGETVTFQAVLYKQSGDIVFVYEDLDVTDSFFIDGDASNVGIGTDGFLYPETIPPGVFVDGVHDVGGLPGAEDDFVRLAWATGGAAWNNDIISGDSSAFLTQFNSAFIESLGDQILDKQMRGDVAFSDDPLIEINIGGPAIGNYIADTNTAVLGPNFLPEDTIPVDTPNSIVRNGNSMAGDANTLNVFKDGRFLPTGTGPLSLPASVVPNGSYVVELMFASLGYNESMSIFLENQLEPVLKNYRISQDFAKIPISGITAPEFQAKPTQLGDGIPIVKRYSVDVEDGNGLQIHFPFPSSAFINGLRILKRPDVVPPTITDVKLSKTSVWDISFNTRLSQNDRSEQMRPISEEAGANTLQITFSEDVVNASGGTMTGSELLLKRTSRLSDGTFVNADLGVSDWNFVYNSTSRIGTWTFTSPLPDGKYALFLSDSIRDAAGNRLDAEWQGINYDDNGTPDTFADDPIHSFAYNVTRGIGNGVAGTKDGAFRFHFALLAGDTDGDGRVGTDFLPVLKHRGADFNDDEIVNNQDLLIWQASFGINANGDADGDVDTDGVDFLRWQNNVGNQSAWYLGAAAVSALTVGLPPQVNNVIISGSLSAHAPFSFDTVDGSGAQLGTVPVGLADTISIVFSEDVNVSATSLIVVGMTTANVPGLAEFNYDSLTHTATWRFEGWALADNYLLYLTDSITDTEGNFLDGEWVNPASRTTTNALVSEFPSGDGDSGGAFVFAMTLLPGDANRDGIVTYADYSIWAANYYSPGVKTFIQADFNGDGVTNSFDVSILYAHMNQNLQSPFLLADLDQDGDVDDDDLQIMSDNYGLTSASWGEGDLNDDGVVDNLDIDLAFAQFGLWFNSVA